jgi:nucleoside-diphosphate-sugar epimerase
MSILVTGAAGFIGSNVARMLVEDGQDVVGLGSSGPRPDSVIAEIAEKIPFVAGRIEDLAFLLNVIREHNVEGIIHCAALRGGLTNMRPTECVRVNIEGTINMLEAARILKLKRVVCLSSAGVAGDHIGRSLPLPLKEEELDLQYGSMYQVSKLANELHVSLYRKRFNVDAVACRPCKVWGPGSNPWEDKIPDPGKKRKDPVALAVLVQDAVAGRPIKLETGGDTTIDYTYIKDHARGLIQALQAKPTKSSVFNLSGGKPVSVFQITEVLKRVFPKLPIEVGPGHVGEVASLANWERVVRPANDVTRAKEEFGYNPQYGIEKGIPAYAAWLQERKYL